MKESAFENFSEGVMDAVYDFARCQRADGSFYGTGGQCRKGTESGAKEKTATRTRPKAAIESDMKKLSSSGAMAAKGTAGVRAREEHAALKAELKKPLAGARSSKGASTPASSGGAPTSKEVKALDKVAKAADKKAEAADKAYQKAASDARKVEAKAVPDMRASRADPGNKALADKFRVSNMEARNARDKAAILQKAAKKEDRAAKKANAAATKADKEFQKATKSEAKAKASESQGAGKTARKEMIAARDKEKELRAARKTAEAGDDKKAAAAARRAHIDSKKEAKEAASRFQSGQKEAGDVRRFGRSDERNKASIKELKDAAASGKLSPTKQAAVERDIKMRTASEKSATATAKASKDPAVQKRVLQTELKKVSAKYERLRGKPEAAAERKALMDRAGQIAKKQAQVQKRIDGKTATPKKPDTSPAANQRRANAAARARD